ncbi:MAG: hypothetical protein KBT76_14780 [Sulfitobacter litoralis]|nr:hypothetical protein [Sulfitobacter litoralis]
MTKPTLKVDGKEHPFIYFSHERQFEVWEGVDLETGTVVRRGKPFEGATCVQRPSNVVNVEFITQKYDRSSKIEVEYGGIRFDDLSEAQADFRMNDQHVTARVSSRQVFAN